MHYNNAPGVLPKSGTPVFVSGIEEGVAKDASEHVITFAPDGTARCLWTETLPLHELGRLEVHRASTIEFDNNAQQWLVRDRHDSVRFFSKSRAACLRWERRHVDALL